MRTQAAFAVALALMATCAAATPPGFTTDLRAAQAEAQATGKLVFVYFNLPG
jgi:hypothetical protein